MPQQIINVGAAANDGNGDPLRDAYIKCNNNFTDLYLNKGSVTTVSVVPSNGITGSVANPTTTPAITLTLGNITPTTVNTIQFIGASTPKLTVIGTSGIEGNNTGDVTLAGTGTYLSLANQIITQSPISLSSGNVTGDLPYSSLTPATTTSLLLGRGSAAGAGDWQEITLGANLTMTGTVLSASGGSGGGNVSGPASPITDNAIVRWDLTNTNIQNSAVTLSDAGLMSGVDAIQYSLSPGSSSAIGRTLWDTNNKTLSLGIGSGTVQALLGTDSHILAKNTTGSTISKGQVVRVNGASSDNVTVALAQGNTDPNTANTIGIAAEDITNGSTGMIVTAGLLRDVNTTAFAAGDILFISPTTAGLLVNVKPTAPNHAVRMGYVAKASATGIIYVNVNNGYELDELHDVYYPTTPAANDFLVYTSNSRWENQIPATARTSLGLGSVATLNSISLTTNVTGTLPVANGGTGVTTSTGTGSVVLSTSPTLTTPILGTPTSGTLTSCTGLPISTGVAGLGTGVATFLATPNSANLAAAVTDETGTGSLVLATSPTLTTPVLGVASATSINKVAITAPATGSTLTIADGKTLTASNTLTFTGTDASSVAFGTGGTVAYTSGKLSQFAATTSSELAGVISDETGTGSLVFATSPTLVTPALGTPTSGTLTNCTGLPISSGVSGLGTGVATFLATPTSANLATAVTDETGTGSLVLATSPTLVTPLLGTPTSGTLTNCTGLPLTTGVTGRLPFANLTASTAASVLFGRGSASGAGDFQEISIGSGLSMSGTTLSATGGGSGGGSTNVWIPAAQMIPRTTNGAGINTLESSATNKINYDVLEFDSATAEYAQAIVVMPSNYNNGNVTARFYWTATSNSGTPTVTWGIRGRAYGDNVAIDTALGSVVTVQDTVTTANYMLVSSATAAVTIDGTPAANKAVIFEFSRDPSVDDLAVDARLLGVEISYTSA